MKALTPLEMDALVKADATVDIIDVRDENEWLNGHVPRARWIPLPVFRTDPKGALPKDNVIFLCAKGGRSQAAAELAEQLGFKQVYNLEGGIIAWGVAGLPVIVPERPKASTRVQADDTGEGSPGVEVAEPPLDAIVGANLREQRMRRGLSLDVLAAQAGVSRTLLGQIEIGRSIPSIGVVWKIAQSLGVPFSTLLSTHTPAGASVLLQRATAKRLLSADGRFSSRALFPFGEARTMEFYELWLAAHSAEEAEAHQAGTKENIVVTAGKLDLKVGTETFHLETGDALVFSADVPHSYTNPGNNECWMYLVMTYTVPIA